MARSTLDRGIEKRRKAWKPRQQDFLSGALWQYPQIVGPTGKGAVTHPGAKAETYCCAEFGI